MPIGLRITCAAVALLATALPQTATAQGSHAGQWACQMTYTELDPWGNRTSGFVRDYMMAIYPDGRFEAQGSLAGAAGVHQFCSQGQWQAQGADMIASGPEQSSDPFQMPGMQFVFTGTLQADGSMSYRYEQADPSGRYLMIRTLYACQRRG